MRKAMCMLLSCLLLQNHLPLPNLLHPLPEPPPLPLPVLPYPLLSFRIQPEALLSLLL